MFESLEELLEALEESGIEVSKRELTSITKFYNDTEQNNIIEELSYTFFIKPKPAKRPRTGLNGFYDPDQTAKKDFTKFIMNNIGHDEEFAKEWLKHKNRSTKKKIAAEDKEESKEFIKEHCLFLGMCSISLDIFLAVPNTMSNFKKKLAYIGYIRPENKPDIDNYEKFIYDSINSIFYLDDGQIVSNENNLYYCPEGEERIEMTIQYRPYSLL